MREQDASSVFAPLLERKKSGLKISGRDEINDQRKRLNESYVNDFGGKSIVNIPGVRLKGISTVNHGKDQDLDGAGLEKTEKVNDLEKVESLNGMERIGKLKEKELEEGRKRRMLDDDLFLQWGHRNPRGTRLDTKHTTDDSSFLSKKTVREDRRIPMPEKQLAVTQIRATTKFKAQTSRFCDPDCCQNGLIMGRRNGLNFRSSSKWASTNAKDCASNDDRHHTSNAPERSDRHASFSPDKNARDSVCPWSTDAASPDDGFRASIQNGGEAGNAFPPTLQKVDLELFEWPRFLISLSRKEKEEDFMAIKGSKLPHRPKRRPKVVEKALHYCSPGTWLGDLTRGRYDVREKKTMKKKPRGLKAMESSDSLSA